MVAETPKTTPKKSGRSTPGKTAAAPAPTPVASSRKGAASKAETPAAAAPQPRRSGKKTVDAGDREQMIAVRAYYLAEERGFADGDCVADWLAAEEWVDGQLRAGKPAAS
jgi:hypothetical protein